MCIVLDWFVTIISGLTEHINSIDTFLIKWRNDDSGVGGDDVGVGGDDVNNINKYYLLLLINNNFIAETC